MIVVVTNSEDKTSDYLISKLQANKKVVRIDTDLFGTGSKYRFRFKSGATQLLLNHKPITPGRVDCVIYRRPKQPRRIFSKDKSENAQICQEWIEVFTGFIYQIPIKKWINFPSSNQLASNKVEQLIRARRFGLKSPKSLVTNSKIELQKFFKECNGKIITKTLGYGFIERPNESHSVIYTNDVTPEKISLYGNTLKACPTLFQKCIKKKMDVRVTVLDSQVFGVGMANRSHGRIDIRFNNMVGMDYYKIAIPFETKGQLIKFVKSYNLRFAQIDMIIDQNDQWHFLEINPNGQWAWLDLVGASQIWKMFEIAMRRI